MPPPPCSRSGTNKGGAIKLKGAINWNNWSDINPNAAGKHYRVKLVKWCSVSSLSRVFSRTDEHRISVERFCGIIMHELTKPWRHNHNYIITPVCSLKDQSPLSILLSSILNSVVTRSLMYPNIRNTFTILDAVGSGRSFFIFSGNHTLSWDTLQSGYHSFLHVVEQS